MINFGIVYGISAFGLSENLEIPREEAQAYIDAYLARFPHVQDFIQRTIEQAARDGYVTSLLGRRRPVPELRASNRQTRSLGERLAVNFVMQGSNADIIKVAMVAIHRRLRDEGPQRPPCPPGARRAPARGARGRGRPRARARPRGDVPRLPARPAAGGRRRRRRRLERSEALARAGVPQRAGYTDRRFDGQRNHRREPAAAGRRQRLDDDSRRSGSRTTTPPSRRSTRARSSTAPSSAWTRTRCSSTSATSRRA